MFRLCALLSLVSFGQWSDRPPLRPRATGPKLVSTSQRDYCVPFFSFDFVFRAYTFLLFPFTSSRSVALPFVFSWADCYLWTVGICPTSSSHGCRFDRRVVYFAISRQYEVWGNLWPIFCLLRIAATSIPFPVSGCLLTSLDCHVICIYDYSGWANVIEFYT